MLPDAEVTGKACPLLVPLVEEGLFHDSVTDEIASRYLSELKAKYVDTLVLGCTHYPLLRSAIKRLMGEEVTLVNPAYETAVELRELLKQNDLIGTGAAGQEEKYQFYVSDLAEKFTSFASAIVPEQVKAVSYTHLDDSGYR